LKSPSRKYSAKEKKSQRQERETNWERRGIFCQWEYGLIAVDALAHEGQRREERTYHPWVLVVVAFAAPGSRLAPRDRGWEDDGRDRITDASKRKNGEPVKPTTMHSQVVGGGDD
jgi:hypothetical protein